MKQFAAVLVLAAFASLAGATTFTQPAALTAAPCAYAVPPPKPGAAPTLWDRIKSLFGVQ